MNFYNIYLYVIRFDRILEKNIAFAKIKPSQKVGILLLD